MSEQEQLRIRMAGITALNGVDEIVTALFKDLGESPEAVRGAACVAEMCRQMMGMIVGPDIDPGERDIDAEMSTAGVVLMMLMRTIHARLKLMEGP